MTLTIHLSSEAESRLKDEAHRKGVAVDEYARQILEQELQRKTGQDSTISLLSAWDLEDSTDDPGTLEARRKEAEDFKRALNESHSSLRRVYP